MTEDEEFATLEQRLNMKETKQPEALRLADLLERLEGWHYPTGAPEELRRLHALNQELLEALQKALYGLQYHTNQTGSLRLTNGAMQVVRAAIAKAQGASNE